MTRARRSSQHAHKLQGGDQQHFPKIHRDTHWLLLLLRLLLQLLVLLLPLLMSAGAPAADIYKI